MATWRSLAVLATLIVVGTAPAQTYSLVESPQVGDCCRVQLSLKLEGELRVNRQDKVVPLKLLAQADHQFPERVLALDAKGVPQKVARHYATARALITVDGDRSERTLRADRQTLVAHRCKDQNVLYCPVGSLTREELELTSEHFETMQLVGLLPGKAVAADDTWKITHGTAQVLCHFEGLTMQDLTGKLDRVQDEVAYFRVQGTASGIDLGAMVKMTIDASCQFDLKARRLTVVEWKQKDEREQGPASPASTVEAVTRLTRTAIETPRELSDVALVAVPDGEPPAALLHLHVRDPRSRFDLDYGREWQTVSHTEEHLVMRLLDRGDFVAQVTVTPWKSAESGKHLSGEEFAEAMASTPGWEPDQVLQSGEVPHPEKDRWIYRISALGEMDGLKVLQNFYLVAGQNGEQVVVAFTMKQAQADRLGTRDLTLVSSVGFPASRKDPRPR